MVCNTLYTPCMTVLGEMVSKTTLKSLHDRNSASRGRVACFLIVNSPIYIYSVNVYIISIISIYE